MPPLIGNLIAVLLVAGLVYLALREILKGRKEGGCSGCSGSCASCGHSCSHSAAYKKDGTP